MLEKDTFLEKIKRTIFIIVFFLISKTLIADTISLELLNYNKSLENSTASFIQSDGKTLEEGVIYIGSERIKIEYVKPTKITLVISKKKAMYVNHSLEETEYFNTNKSFIKFFFKILTGEKSFDESDLVVSNNSVEIKNDFEINNTPYKTWIIYEKNPIKIRKIKLEENNRVTEIGFFSHKNVNKISKDFFSLIDPYLLN